MEWLIIIIIILIAFIPIIYRINRRFHQLESKLNEVRTSIKKGKNNM